VAKKANACLYQGKRFTLNGVDSKIFTECCAHLLCCQAGESSFTGRQMPLGPLRVDSYLPPDESRDRRIIFNGNNFCNERMMRCPLSSLVCFALLPTHEKRNQTVKVKVTFIL